jgi:hypothetical protein
VPRGADLDLRLSGLRNEQASTAEAVSGDDEPGSFARPTQRPVARSAGPQDERIHPVQRGWAGYFKLSQSKRSLEELDGWVQHKLRCVV